MISKTDVAVIVGRFQVHELHEEHRRLIDEVVKNHYRVLIFLGVSPLRNTKQNPLDFVARQRMIQDLYPSIEVFAQADEPDDFVWGKKLDARIKDVILPDQKAVLYGGRDSFISRYHGTYPVIELEPKIIISGTETRRRVSMNHGHSHDFRTGAIWASQNRYDSVVPTVDIAILRDNEVLLGQKTEDQGKYRFVGGFADVNSDSYELDAAREVREETGLEVSNLRYLGSAKIDDWRFRSESDKIKTLFYTADYVFGHP